MARPSLKPVVEGITTSFMLLASVGALFLVWQNLAAKSSGRGEGTLPVPKAPIALEGAAFEGNPNAPYALVIFSDFECPFCRSFAQKILPSFRDEYVNTGKVLVSFRHLPLKIHQSARPAAQAAVCAQAQGKFWPLHDAFFADPANLRDISKAASNAGLNATSFAACNSSEATARAVDTDIELAKMLEVHVTPTFMFGTNDGARTAHVTKRFAGAPNYESFKQQIGSLQDGPGR